MNDKLAIVGQIIDTEDDPRDATIARLEREIKTLKRAVSDAETNASRAREDADRAMSMLRRQLGPLYRALQAVFGELDAAGVTDSAPAPASPAAPTGQGDRASAVWEAWKSKLGEGPARVIDVLLLHGDMNTTQLAIACRASKRSVPAWIYKLNQAGLINKNGGRFSLKSLS
jgi:hypothetical protein